MKILIREFHFYFYVKRDRLEFRVNVKEFWLLFVTREKAKYFCVTELQRGIGDPPNSSQGASVVKLSPVGN